MELILDKTQIDYTRLQNSKLSFHRNTKARPIFHYTSIGGLEGILEHKTLRFTNIKYMNDKDEIFAGIDSLVKACNGSDKTRERLRSICMDTGVQTFVCCFSVEADSLPMWNYYTKEINNQGYNIEFADKKLVESILRNNPALDGCGLSFGIVDYCKDNDSEYSKIITGEILTSMHLSISKLFAAVANGILYNHPTDLNEPALAELEKKIANSEKKQKLNNLPVYFYNGEKCRFEKRQSGEYWYYIKRDYFRQEGEFRIVITVPDGQLAELKDKGIYKFRVGNGILVPFIELSFSTDAVKSITISPTVQSDLVEFSIQDFLNYCAFHVEDCSKFIKHSSVPVRF